MKLFEISITDPVAVLRAYALQNYENGGAEVYETFDDVDYVEILQTCDGDIEKAKEQLKHDWIMMKSVRDDIRGS